MSVGRGARGGRTSMVGGRTGGRTGGSNTPLGQPVEQSCDIRQTAGDQNALLSCDAPNPNNPDGRRRDADWVPPRRIGAPPTPTASPSVGRGRGISQRTSLRSMRTQEQLKCIVCKMPGDQSKLLFCSEPGDGPNGRCGAGFHSYCLGFPDCFIPPEPHFCPMCRSMPLPELTVSHDPRTSPRWSTAEEIASRQRSPLYNIPPSPGSPLSDGEGDEGVVAKNKRRRTN